MGTLLPNDCRIRPAATSLKPPQQLPIPDHPAPCFLAEAKPRGIGEQVPQERIAPDHQRALTIRSFRPTAQAEYAPAAIE